MITGTLRKNIDLHEKVCIFVLYFKSIRKMETITLEYDERNKHAKQMIDIMLSLGLATRKKAGLEQALEDVAHGRLTTIHTPKKQKIQ